MGATAAPSPDRSRRAAVRGRAGTGPRRATPGWAGRRRAGPPPRAAALIEAWSPYWDLERPLLLEKSPPNLVMGRFLQAIFPGSAMIVVLRHPIVVALSTKKWAPRTSLRKLVAHWFAAHDIFRADLARLTRVHVLRYEDLVADPAAQLRPIERLLRIDGAIPADRLQASRSSAYEQQWDRLRTGGAMGRRRRARIEAEFGTRCAEYGYDVSDLRARKPWTMEPPARDG